MKDSTLSNMETILRALREIHEAEEKLIKLQTVLDECLRDVGTRTLGEAALMPMVPIVRFHEAEERLIEGMDRLCRLEASSLDEFLRDKARQTADWSKGPDYRADPSTFLDPNAQT